MRTNIWIENSSNVFITGIHLSNNGWPNTPGNSIADPNIYIANSSNVLIQWGQILGQNNWPFGDGEIACYFSDNVTISGTQLFFSGTSAIYFVGCDNSRVENANIQFAGGWGLDIVSGSDNFTAINNSIKYSRLGASIFQETQQTGGTYKWNIFNYNNTSGFANCNGLNITGDPLSMSISGNSANPAPISCGWNN